MNKQFNFSEALDRLKDGACVARHGWNGADMFIFMVNGSEFKVNRQPLLSILGDGTDVVYQPHLDMKLADGSIMTWNAAQIDIFAEDWYEV